MLQLSAVEHLVYWIPDKQRAFIDALAPLLAHAVTPHAAP